MFANFSACSEKCSISTHSCSIHMRTDIALINTRAFAANSRPHRVYWGVGGGGEKESQECGQILRKPAIYTLKFRWPPHPFGSSAITVDVVVQMIGSMVVSKLTTYNCSKPKAKGWTFEPVGRLIYYTNSTILKYSKVQDWLIEWNATFRPLRNTITLLCPPPPPTQISSPKLRLFKPICFSQSLVKTTTNGP